MNRYCGIDWAEGHPDIAIVDQDDMLVSKERITDDPAGFTALTRLLAEAGDTAENPIPVAIETVRGLMVAAIRATGRPIYAINPMAVARYRARHSVARAKSDHADAMTLPTSCASMPTCTGKSRPTANWPKPSRSWPAPSKTQYGGGPKPSTSCGRCCAIPPDVPRRVR